MNAPLLELRQITVSFDGFLALRDLNLSLQPGELRAVIGPNGAGKTTFLDVITGKTAPTEGDVVLRAAPWWAAVSTASPGSALVANSRAQECSRSSVFRIIWRWR